MTIPLNVELKGPRVSLRRFTWADAERVNEILSDWDVARMLRMAPYPPAIEDTSRWLGEHEGEWRSGNAYRFAVVTKSRVIGCADLDEILNGTGELGYWFDRAYWGNGFALEAAALVHEFAWQTLGLDRLVSGHALDNPASGRILERLGFVRTGDRPRWYRSRQAEVPHRHYVCELRFVDG